MASNLRQLTIFWLSFLFLSACNSSAGSPLPTKIFTQTPTLTLTRTPMITITPNPPKGTPQTTQPFLLDSLVPKPVSAIPAGGSFYLTPGMMIFVEPATEEVLSVGQFLAGRLNPATGYDIRVEAKRGALPLGSIFLTLADPVPSFGEEGYQLTITPELIKVSANQPAGLFYGVQTLRQLLPPAIESDNLQPGPWVLATGKITDYPRFAWRAAMLDVARHFFTVHDVEQYMDLLAFYKINHLHLHLTDDQGWRIEIKSWPDLTSIGGRTQIGGGPGGFYTQAEYTEIVNYARSRYITVVPEIDMPGHVTAALVSYPILNCSGVSPEISTTIHVKYSSLCVSSDSSYSFMQDVLHEVAGLTPGPFIHIGGDEAGATSAEDYIAFMQRAQAVVEAEGKHVIGWEEIAQIKLSSGSIVQHWNLGDGNIQQVLQQGNRLIMSPVEKVYLNIKYDPSTQLGPDVGLYLNVETAYDWDPVTLVNGVNEKDILGIEAPLWTETLQTMANIEYMAFPRILGIAEIGWTPQAERNWEGYRGRLAEQGPRLTELGVSFFRSPEITWK
jgi:hexosaminidase